MARGTLVSPLDFGYRQMRSTETGGIMDQDARQTNPPEQTEADARREFIKKLGKASAAAPAIALLMAANYKDAQAQNGGGSGSSGSGSS
jgi:hypothetical protein